jgi:uncharacterized membrane protein HdeD (DUF308 family)
MMAIFLLGFTAAASITASLFFLRFWRDSRDRLFLAFTAFFLIEGITRVLLVFYAHPGEGSPGIYLARLLGMLLILSAILKKNYPGEL